MAPHIVMLDDVDLSKPEANHLDWLFWLKGNYPTFKVNLFCIPGRSNFSWLLELNKIEWIRVCFHGWNHRETEEITIEMVEAWTGRGLPKVYKGPNWQVSDKSLYNLEERGFKVIQKPLLDNYFQGHIWTVPDLQKIEELLKTGVETELL